MKLVIIEGLDNTGKTTVIHELMQRYNNVHYIHATKPEIDDPVLCALHQQDVFAKMVSNIQEVFCNVPSTDLIILDRSWIGEYVYGCMYRGNGDTFVENMIADCYNRIANANRLRDAPVDTLDCTTILYTVRTPEFCLKNEDDQSLSARDVKKISIERDRFEKIMSSSVIRGKKKIITVEDKNGEFLPKEHILNLTINAIDNDNNE